MSAPVRRAKPLINVIGTVEHIGGRVVIDGWRLATCLRQCRCHHNPAVPWLRPEIAEFPDGSLGLRKFRACYCCEAWTWQELAGIARDARDFADLETVEEPTS